MLLASSDAVEEMLLLNPADLDNCWGRIPQLVRIQDAPDSPWSLARVSLPHKTADSATPIMNAPTVLMLALGERVAIQVDRCWGEQVAIRQVEGVMPQGSRVERPPCLLALLYDFRRW